MNKLMMINNTRILQLQVIQIPLDNLRTGKLWERYNKLSELTERLGKNS